MQHLLHEWTYSCIWLFLNDLYFYIESSVTIDWLYFLASLFPFRDLVIYRGRCLRYVYESHLTENYISTLETRFLIPINYRGWNHLNRELITFPSWSSFYIISILFHVQKVTPWNARKLQEAINNGADIHPGATHYRDNNNMYKLQAAPPKRRAIAKMLPASRGSISQPGKDPKCEFESKVVYRHLQDGDVVLVNRQV